MTADLLLVPLAVLLLTPPAILARSAYRRLRADLPVLWLLWRCR